MIVFGVACCLLHECRSYSTQDTSAGVSLTKLKGQPNSDSQGFRASFQITSQGRMLKVSHVSLGDLQFLSRPVVVGDRIDILTSGGTKFATGFVERVDPIYTVLRTDTGTPVTINNKVCLPLPQSTHVAFKGQSGFACIHSEATLHAESRAPQSAQ